MRVTTILLSALITVLTSSNAALATSIVDRAALSMFTSPDLEQPMNAVQSKLNNRRFLRSHGTVEDLGDGLDEDSDDKERGFVSLISENFAKIVANFAKLDDFDAKVAAMTKDKTLIEHYDMSLELTKQNVKLFRQIESKGYTPTSLAEKLATSRADLNLSKEEGATLLAKFEEFWTTYPRRPKASN